MVVVVVMVELLVLVLMMFVMFPIAWLIVGVDEVPPPPQTQTTERVGIETTTWRSAEDVLASLFVPNRSVGGLIRPPGWGR